MERANDMIGALHYCYHSPSPAIVNIFYTLRKKCLQWLFLCLIVLCHRVGERYLCIKIIEKRRNETGCMYDGGVCFMRLGCSGKR